MTDLMLVSLPAVFLKDNYRFSFLSLRLRTLRPHITAMPWISFIGLPLNLDPIPHPVWGGADHLNVGTHLPLNYFHLTPCSSDVLEPSALWGLFTLTCDQAKLR